MTFYSLVEFGTFFLMEELPPAADAIKLLVFIIGLSPRLDLEMLEGDGSVLLLVPTALSKFFGGTWLEIPRLEPILIA